MNKNLVGRCGLYCGACIIYRAYKDSDQLRQKIAEREKCKPQEIQCEGCQTALTNGWNYDTWFRGRFLEEWAHPQAVKELHGAFAHYDEEDAKAALLATMDLFRWIAVETAEKLGYPYPAKADEHVTKWIRTCLSQKRNARA